MLGSVSLHNSNPFRNPTRTKMSLIEEDESNDPDVEENENQQLNRIHSIVQNGKRDINQILIHGLTCLHSVAANAKLSRALLQWGMDVDVMDNLGQTPLMHAVRSKHPRAVKSILLILEHGSDVNIRDFKGNNALDHALSNSSNIGVFGVAKMVQHGAKRSHGTTAIRPC